MDTVTAHVGATIRVFGAPIETYDALRRRFSFTNLQKKMAHGLDQDTKGLPDVLTGYKEYPDGSLEVPRGTWRDVATIVRFKSKLSFEMNVCDGEALLLGNELRASVHAKLWPFQRTAVEAADKTKNGYLIVPCGGGKTPIGAAIIARHDRSTLIVVPTLDICQQWIETLKEWLGLKAVGELNGSKKKRVCPVTVGVDVTVANMLDSGDLDPDLFGCAIFDECHHLPADRYQRIVDKLRCRYRIGLTATAKRADGRTKLMQWHLGPELFSTTTRELVEDGYLLKATVRAVPSAFAFYMKNAEKYPRHFVVSVLEKAMRENLFRNVSICKLIANEFRLGESCLVLTNNKSHCAALAAILKKEFRLDAVVVTSTTMSKTKRRWLYAQMREGRVRLVIATALANEGLNVRPISRIFLADSSGNSVITEQRCGRALRSFPGKSAPIVYDVFDKYCFDLHVRFDNRVRVYKNCGFPIVMVES